jgi:hypothetical protein
MKQKRADQESNRTQGSFTITFLTPRVPQQFSDPVCPQLEKPNLTDGQEKKAEQHTSNKTHERKS